jgi:hypothetical protein
VISRRGVIAVTAGLLAIAIAGLGSMPATGARPAGKPPKLHHVFIIVLENKNYADTFAAKSKARYLSRKLVAKGELLTRYYGTAHDSLANYIAMVSGQGPNPQTQADCQLYTEFVPGLLSAAGQYLGQGCVFPPGVENIGNQLEGGGYVWKAYQQAMNKQTSGDHGTPGPCRHPGINGNDSGNGAFTDGYVTKHNPFVYFHSIIDFASCAKHDVDLSKLGPDLRHESNTPSYSFITPTMCNDGHNEPCDNGNKGGLTQIDQFLRHQVPRILHSPAYENHGLLMILVDEAHSIDDCISHPCPTGSDPSGCCGEVQGPNTPNNGGIEPGVGGGRTGAVLLSPCIKPGTVNKTPYNHYSMLRSVEDNFGLPHLGYAGTQGLKPFGRKTLNRASCGEQMHLHATPAQAAAKQRQGFHFRVTSPLHRCRTGVRIRFAHQRAQTGRRGRAVIHAKLHNPGRHIAAAREPGCRDGRATVLAT